MVRRALPGWLTVWVLVTKLPLVACGQGLAGESAPHWAVCLTSFGRGKSGRLRVHCAGFPGWPGKCY
jgi:hypothetical protein